MPKSFCIVDPSLQDLVGHHFEYDRSVAAAATAAGYETHVLGHRDALPEVTQALAVRAVFRRGMWDKHPRAFDQGDLTDDLLCNLDHLSDLRMALRTTQMPPGSVLFAHMITAKQLLGLALNVWRTPARRGVETILLLRYQPAQYVGPCGALGFRLLESAVRHGRRVRLVSDSARLAGQLEHLTTLPINVYPIPHTHPPGQPAAHPTIPPRQPGRLRFVSLGNAREEKGYVEILEAVRRLARSTEGLDGLEFVLQSNDPLPDVAAAIAAFSRDVPDGVTLLHSSLPTEAYRALLHSADAVLVPYWRSIYEARTSGTFLEAVAAGKPVIATRDTWMGDELSAYGAGVLIGGRSVGELVGAIRQVARDLPTLTTAAARGAEACLRVHNAESLIAQAIAPARARTANWPPRRVAVIYPWGDFEERRTGASVRCFGMVDTIARHVEEVRVLQPGSQSAQVAGKIRSEAYEARPRRLQRYARKIFGRLTRPMLGRRGEGQDIHLWLHLDSRLDPGFRRRVNELVRWADVVLMEYSYAGQVVMPIARKYGVPVVASTYDIVSTQVSESRIVRRLTMREEVRGLAGADHVVCVSAEDAAVLREHGLAPEIVPNPVDLSRLDASLPYSPRRVLELYGISLPPGPVALFVGSRFAPNMHVADRIAGLARSDTSGLAWVIVGSCAQPRSEGNLIALGQVSEPVLNALYRVATAVLVPLAQGSGTSLKTLEAMAAGRPVIGTKVGFRGLSVRHGQDCWIEDDLACYPDIVARLAADAALAALLGKGGRAFAERFDCWRVFQSYLPLLGFAQMEDEAISSAQAEDRARQELAMLRQLAAAAAARGDIEASHDLAMRVLALAPGDGGSLFAAGEALSRQPGQADRAIEYFRRAEAAGFDLCRARFSVALVYEAAGDLAASRLEIEQAVPARVAMGIGEGNFGRFVSECWDRHGDRQFRVVLALAAAMLEHVMEPGLHFLVGNCLHELDLEPDQALVHYNAALRSGFDPFWASFHAANLLASLRRDAEAQALFRHARDAAQSAELRAMAQERLARNGDAPGVFGGAMPVPAYESHGGSSVHAMLDEAPRRGGVFRPIGRQLRRLWRMPLLLDRRIIVSSSAIAAQIADTRAQLSSETKELKDAVAAAVDEQRALIEDRRAADAAQLMQVDRLVRAAVAELVPQCVDALIMRRHGDLHDLVAESMRRSDAAAAAAMDERRALIEDRRAADAAHLGELDRLVRTAVAELVPQCVDALIMPRHADLRDLLAESIHRGDAIRRNVGDIDRRTWRLTDIAFDLLSAAPSRLPDLGPALSLRTEHPLAAQSADHLHPRGTLNDDTRHPQFVAACARHFGRPVRHLDLGCAGGGLVWDFLRAGHVSYGVEGSDLSLRMRRAYWAVIPDHLFTADVTEPFSIVDEHGVPQRFDVISAWEVLEHIPEHAIAALFDNVAAMLAPGGLFIASVSTFADEEPQTQAVWHVTVRGREWWLERAAARGLRPVETGFTVSDFARGSGNPRADDWDVRNDAALGFHIVLGLDAAAHPNEDVGGRMREADDRADLPHTRGSQQSGEVEQCDKAGA